MIADVLRLSLAASLDSDGEVFGPGFGVVKEQGGCLGFHYVVLDVHGT